VLWTFVPVAVLVTLTPGPATAMVIRSSMTGGVRAALMTVAGNSAGVLVWALLSVLGISALIAASEIAYTVLKVVGAGVLVVLGVQTILRTRRGRDAPPPKPVRARHALRDGFVSAVSNPKLSVFFIALFPQFVTPGSSVLAASVAMALIIVACDVLWFSTIAFAVSRAKETFMRSRAARWLERTTGAVLIALGVRVALQPR